MTVIFNVDAEGFTPNDRSLIDEAEAMAGKINETASLDNWLNIIGPAIMVGRQWAMRQAHTNQPQGQRYATAFQIWRKQRPNIAKLDQNTVTDLLWLLDDPERLEVLADLRQPSAVNAISPTASPITCRQRVRKEIARRAKLADAQAGNDVPEAPLSPMEKLKRDNAELKGLLADAQERLEHLEGKVDGGMFDLKRDKFEDIKAVIDRLPHMASMKRKMKGVRDAIDAWAAVPAKR